MILVCPTSARDSIRGRSHDVRLRIYAEFAEMPGLRLTLAQAARFFNLERAECERILGELVGMGHLTTDGRSFRLPGTCRADA